MEQVKWMTDRMTNRKLVRKKYRKEIEINIDWQTNKL